MVSRLRNGSGHICKLLWTDVQMGTYLFLSRSDYRGLKTRVEAIRREQEGVQHSEAPHDSNVSTTAPLTSDSVKITKPKRMFSFESIASSRRSQVEKQNSSSDDDVRST